MNRIINDKKHEYNSLNRNFNTQYYKGVPLQQIDRGYGNARARRFTLNNTNQNVWIPCKHLAADGTIKANEDIDYLLLNAKKQLELAGIEIQFAHKKATDGNQ